MDIEILKKNYNKVLDREKKAEKFFGIASDEEIEKWLPLFNQLVMELSQMIKDFERLAGREMSKEEVFNGFV